MPALVRLLDYLVGCVAVELGVRGTQELLAYLDNPAKTRVSGQRAGRLDVGKCL